MPLQYDPEWRALAGPALEAQGEILPVHDVATRRSRYEQLFIASSYTFQDDIELNVYGTPASDGYEIQIYHLSKKGTHKPSGRTPAVLHIHGGGFDFSARQGRPALPRALRLPCPESPSFRVDYRSPPRTFSPHPLEDCWSALLYLQSHVDEPGRESFSDRRHGRERGRGSGCGAGDPGERPHIDAAVGEANSDLPYAGRPHRDRPFRRPSRFQRQRRAHRLGCLPRRGLGHRQHIPSSFACSGH